MTESLLVLANAAHIPLADESVHCVVTSPPYFGLRDYGLEPLVWGGNPECQHVWGNELPRVARVGHGQGESTLTGGHESWGNRDGGTQGQFCQRCGAWRGCLGLEPTPEMYVEHMVEIFREVRRVLKPWGTAWLNLGDTYSSGGVSANLSNLIAERIKESVIFLGSGCSLTITAESNDVLEHDQSTPEHVFLCLFGVQRVSIKQGDNNFRQILYGLTPITNCWVAPSVVASMDKANGELVLDPQNGIRIVISNRDLNTDSTLEVPILAGTAKDTETTFSVEEAREPVPESVGNIQATGNTIALNSSGEGLSQIDFVDESVSFADALAPSSQRLSDLSITKASLEHLSFTLMGGGVKFTVNSVAHLFISNPFGSLIRYAEVYHQAKQMSNERQAKQEIGIPDMVKRALMRDGWICRSTIIWSKPSCMPESVKDRPTRAHEYVFLLAKSDQYYYDWYAVREPAKASSLKRWPVDSVYTESADWTKNQQCAQRVNPTYVTVKTGPLVGPTGRNRRTVWTIPSMPYSGAHFATFPPKLVEPCILAGTSEVGVCPVCGRPWKRIVKREAFSDRPKSYPVEGARGRCPSSYRGTGQPQQSHVMSKVSTVGWRPTCEHSGEAPVPSVVLDPFCGSGTTGVVALEHNRSFVGLDLNRTYIEELARGRLAKVQRRLPTSPVNGTGSSFVQQRLL